MQLAGFSFLGLIALPFCLIAVACQPSGKSIPPSQPEKYTEVQADGGGRVGNGGGGHVCRSGSEITRAELWDFYEARNIQGNWKVDLDVSIQDPDPLKQAIAIARAVVSDRWAEIDPVMAGYVDKLLNNFEDESALTGYPLQRLHDVHTVVAPEPGCFREQIAIQRIPQYPGDKRYLIQKSIFEHRNFDPIQRAGLVLHEVIYRLTRLGGAKTSQTARYLTSLFFANQQRDIFTDIETYFRLSRSLNLPWAGANGVAIRLDHEFVFSKADTGNNYLVFGSAMPGSWAHSRYGKEKVQIGCEIEFAEDKLAKSFSLIKREEAPFFVIINDRSYKVVPSLQFTDSDWENVFSQNYCPRRHSPIYDVKDLEAIVKYREIELGVPLKQKRIFFEIDAIGAFDVAVQQTGNVTAKIASGSLTFLKNGHPLAQCEVLSVIEGGATVSRCRAKLSNDLVFNIQGNVRDFDGELTLQLDITSESQVLVHRPQASDESTPKNIELVLKPGSEVTFDTEGKIVRATILNSPIICHTDGENKKVMANSVVDFAESGCVERSWAL